MKNIIYTFFLILLFSSCQRANKSKITDLLKEWSRKEIVFPESMQFTLVDKPCNDTVFFASKYKILAYVDSSGCFSCKLKLDKWKKLIKELDSVPVLFYFFPRSVEEIESFLKQDRFTYPVCIDKADSLNKLNHFPLNEQFRIFLLDKDNRVIALGDPIQNPKIKELYLSILSGNKSISKATHPVTEIKIEERSIDLGQFDWKQEKTGCFTLRNVGKNLLIIDDITTSCGCIVVDYSKEPVQPDKSLDIKVTYKAEHPEHFDKTITVYGNFASSPQMLKIRGDAR